MSRRVTIEVPKRFFKGNSEHKISVCLYGTSGWAAIVDGRALHQAKTEQECIDYLDRYFDTTIDWGEDWVTCLDGVVNVQTTASTVRVSLAGKGWYVYIDGAEMAILPTKSEAVSRAIEIAGGREINWTRKR